jgi:hypothetical protein
MKKLPIYIVKKRIRVLESFLELSRNYFGSLQASSFGGSSETNASLAYRSQLNALISSVESYVRQSDTTDTYLYRAPPVVGGYAQNISVIQNIFSLHSNQISPLVLFDVLERSIADYSNDINYAWIRTFNPIYWIGVFIHYLASFPFKLLTSVGFNGEKAKHSLLGKVIMLLINVVGALITALSGVVTILAAINRLEWVQPLLLKMGIA